MSQRIWPWSDEPSEAAEAIMFTCGASTGDPKAAIIRLLRQYLESAQEQAVEDARRGQQLKERDQQN